MRKFILFVFVLAVLGGACATRSQSETKQVRTVEWMSDKSLSMKELIDSVEFISLEVSDSAIFGYPVFVSYTPEKIFVIGNEGGAVIKAFDKRGKYLNDVGMSGRGPGEYINVNNWETVGDTLYIGDIIQKKLLLYLANGQRLGEFQLPPEIRKVLGGKEVRGVKVKPFEGGYCFFPMRSMLDKDMKGDYAEWVMTDRNFQFRNKLVEAGKDEAQEGYMGWVNRKSGDTLFIFNRRGNLVKQFYFDFGSEQITPDVYKALSGSELTRYKAFMTSALMVGDYAFINLKANGKLQRCALNWKTGQLYKNQAGKINEKIINLMSCCPEENSVMAIITSPRSTGFKEILEELQTGMEENGGLILIKYWLKK